MTKEQAVETWRPVPDYPDYLVSDLGNVKSLKFGKDRLLKVARADGYLSVSLAKNGKQITKKVHRLVMLAFVGPAPDGMQVRHLDGDRSNGRLENLTYGTGKENAADKNTHGTNFRANKTECPKGHPYDEENTYIARTHGYSKRNCKKCREQNQKRHEAKIRAIEEEA